MTDPIKGTRPRGRDAAEDRALARELLSSAKDRAENVMIVDVLRNDLGRVCRPGQRPRPAAVPARADGRRPAPGLDRDRGPRPGPRRLRPARRVVPGRLDHGRPEDPGDGDPRGPRARPARARTPARIGWIGPDGAMQTSIVIRTFVADGRRLTLHVGGGITWKSDPAAEWDETVAKARGPLGAIGGGRGRHERAGDAAERRGRARLGRRPPAAGRRHATCRSSIAASSSATASSRRCASGAPVRPSWPSTSPGSVAPRPASTSRCPPTSTRRLVDGIADLLAADGLDGPTGDASVRITVSRGPFRGRGLLPPDEVVAADDRDPGLAGRAAARPAISSAASTSSRRPSAGTRRTRSPRSRRPRAPTTSTPGSRRAGPAPTTRSS